MPRPEAHRFTQLDNGVRILTEEVPGMRSVSLGVWVQSGSRHEAPGHGGMSHFLEHLLFKGTERRSAREIAQAVEDVGGGLNAFTGKETTCYYAKVLGSDAALAVDILTDVFLSPTFPPEEVDRERSVIVQEILQGEDTPEDLVHDVFARAFWPDHALGRPIAGSVASVQELEREALRRFMDDRYRADRILVAGAGAVRHDDLVAALQAPFGAVPPSDVDGGEAAPAATGGVTVMRRSLEQAHVCLGVPAVSQDDPDRYALQMLNVALGGGMSSRLFQRIREESGRAYAVYSYVNAFTDCGYLGIYAGTSPEWVPEVVASIEAILEDVRRHGLERREIERARAQLNATVLLGLETSDGRMSRLARGCLALGRPVTVDEICEALAAVTADDVARVSARIGAAPGRCLAVLGDVDEGHVGLA